MTNIITALTFITLATNWHGVENANYEVQLVTKTTHLQYGTNAFVLNTETEIGREGLRARPASQILFWTNNAQWLREWIMPDYRWTNWIVPFPTTTTNNCLRQGEDGVLYWGPESPHDNWINRKLEQVPSTNPVPSSLPGLSDWNSERSAEVWRLYTFPQPNGIACPKCGSELMDSDSGVLTSMPPQRNVHCPKCGYKGYRFD